MIDRGWCYFEFFKTICGAASRVDLVSCDCEGDSIHKNNIIYRKKNRI
jgi:hypothetical protein